MSQHSSRPWIIATIVCALAAVGLGVWAFSLRSDNQDKDDQIAAQQQQLENAQGVGAQVREAASQLGDDARQALSQLGDQIDQIEGTAQATQADIQQQIEEAQARAQEAGDDLRARADQAEARAEAAGACARGYLSAIGRVFDAGSLTDGVAQARTDIEQLSGSCESTLEGG
jgi:chromosome segregation ATPase